MTDGTRIPPRGRLRVLIDRARARLTPDVRRRLLRGGIVTIALLALVIVPGVYASQSGFYQRYEGMRPQYAGWETSVHAKVSCTSCHVRPGIIPRSAHAARMLGEFYLSVIPSREPDVLARPTDEACSSCHIDLRTVSPAGDLDIPHRAHVDVLEIECVSCHEFLVHEKSPEGRNAPRMLMCLECHDGEQASNACTDCHTEKAAPDNHKAADWVIVHPERLEEEDCESCHGWTEKWCVECHTRRPTSHTAKWRSEHRDTVETRRNCEVCHEADFCIRCHGEVPSLNLDPSLALVE